MLLQELKKLKSSELIEFAKFSLFTMNEEQRTKSCQALPCSIGKSLPYSFRWLAKKITRYGA
jgi:hypothetical protein